MSNKFQIFSIFFSVGCLSFGGPVAHIGYFQTLFVQRLKWLDDEEFNRLNALCTLLPGPSSSQLGFAIGFHRGGIWGALQAFLGFTLPSFVLMTVAGIGLLEFTKSSITWLSIIAALKIFAVIVVADACAAMQSNLCTTRQSQWIFIATTALLLLGISPSIVILGAGVLGLLTAPKGLYPTVNMRTRINWIAATAFIGLLIASSFYNDTLWGGFFIVGSTVFGGGHVVLPLITQHVSQSITSDTILAGYALAQALPGPMFTFASYLGAISSTATPILGACIATVAIFLPGFLLVMTFNRHWQTLHYHPLVQAVMGGLHPAMVALLASTLFAYIIPSSIFSYFDIALAAIAALVFWWAPRGLLLAALFLIVTKTLL